MAREKMKVIEKLILKIDRQVSSNQKEIEIKQRKDQVALHVNRIKCNRTRIDISLGDLKRLEQEMVTEKEKADYYSMTKDL
jgi:hypothetical protein